MNTVIDVAQNVLLLALSALTLWLAYQYRQQSYRIKGLRRLRAKYRAEIQDLTMKIRGYKADRDAAQDKLEVLVTDAERIEAMLNKRIQDLRARINARQWITDTIERTPSGNDEFRATVNGGQS